MSERTKRALMAFLELSLAEKGEFFNELRKGQPALEQRGIGVENFGKAHSINFGPKGAPCPLCHK